MLLESFRYFDNLLETLTFIVISYSFCHLLSIFFAIDFYFNEWFNVIMKNIFVPVFKTKRSSEKNAIEKTSSLILGKDDIIPYLEAIKSISEPVIKKYIDLMGDNRFFIEPLSKEELNALFDYGAAIPVYLINRDTKDEEIDDFVKKSEQLNRSIAFKISDSDSLHAHRLEPLLKEKDFLIINLGNNDYGSSLFLSSIKVFYNFKCQIIILSNERSVSASGSDLNKNYNNKYSDNVFFNHSVIEAIKSGSFNFDGFASYCGAKNDLTEDVKISKEIFGYLISFNYDKNAFYIVTSDTRNHITRVYNDLLSIISGDREIISIYSRTPISNDLLQEHLLTRKLSCQKKITIEIVHYIEEIVSAL